MKKKLIITLAILALIGGAIWSYSYFNDTPTDPTQAEIDQSNADDTVSGPEKDIADNESTGGSPSDQPPDQDPDNKQAASVSISSAGIEGEQVVVRALANVFEDGTCTATFTKGGTVKTYTVDTEQQPQYTQCNPFQIPKSDFSSGTWQLKVTFESTNYKGEATGEVSIP